MMYLLATTFLAVVHVPLPSASHPHLVGLSFDTLVNESSDWDAVMQLDVKSGATAKLAPYDLDYTAAALGQDGDLIWIVLEGGVIQWYNMSSGKVNHTISVELDLSLCDPPWAACLAGLHFSQRRHAFVGMALGYPFNKTIGHATSSHVVIANPHETKPGAYGVKHVPLTTAVAVPAKLGMYEDASAFDDATDTYYAVMAPPPPGSPLRLRRGQGSSPTGQYELYAFNIRSGASRHIPVAGGNMPFPFVLPTGAKQAIAVNTHPGTSCLMPPPTFLPS